jgi:signal transduction histidine kinase
VQADPGHLEQVLMNLAVNARDAMPEGGRLAIVTRNEDLQDREAAALAGIFPGTFVTLTVADTGHGIPEHVRAHIFEPFFTTKEQGKGTGLGLATVYGIVKQSGGWIYLDEAPGPGASFKIYLPRMD